MHSPHCKLCTFILRVYEQNTDTRVCPWVLLEARLIIKRKLQRYLCKYEQSAGMYYRDNHLPPTRQTFQSHMYMYVHCTGQVQSHNCHFAG